MCNFLPFLPLKSPYPSISYKGINFPSFLCALIQPSLGSATIVRGAQSPNSWEVTLGAPWWVSTSPFMGLRI